MKRTDVARVLVIALMVAACADVARDGAPDGRGADGGALDVAAGDAGDGGLLLALGAALAAEGPAGATLPAPVLAVVTGPDGPVAGVRVVARVTGGGGAVAPEEADTDADGRASFAWTLGVAPVENRLALSLADGPDDGPHAAVRGVVTEPLAPTPFGEVDAWLAEHEVTGSTEDLAFSPDGGLVVGVPGGLARVAADGSVAAVPLTGDPIVRPLGIAYDADGALWVADEGGHALRRVDPEGGVTTVLSSVDGAPLPQPNDVAVGPDGRVYLSDPCLGAVLRLDATGAVEARLDLDRRTEGGPNGLAFDAEGALHVLTENTAVLCAHGDVDPVALLGHLYRVEAGSEGFGERVRLAEGLGHFGDGLAFDAEGNLYAVVDRLDGLALAESVILVRAAGTTTLVPFVRATDRLLANLAFGQGEYGAETLYATMLAVPLLTDPSRRGLLSVPVGIAGPSPSLGARNAP